MRNYYVKIPGRKEVTIEAHSLHDASWRVRSLLDVGRLPPGTEIARSDVRAGRAVCEVRAKELRIGISMIGAHVHQAHAEKVKAELDKSMLIKDVQTSEDGLVVTIDLPNGFIDPSEIVTHVIKKIREVVYELMANDPVAA